MKRNYDIRLNPKNLSEREVAKHQDFDALLQKFEVDKSQPRPERRPALRRIMFLAGAIAAAITVLLIIYYGMGSEDYQLNEQQYFANQPYVNPPLTNVKPQFASYQVSADEGGVYKYPSGSQLTVPAAAFVGENGEAIQGEVTIRYREMHDFVDFFLSGIPMTYDSAGVEYTLESAGMIEIFAEQNGQRVRMASGKSIDVELVSRVNVSPELEVPKDFNIYKLDTENRAWAYQEIDRIELLDEGLAFGQIEVDDPLFAEKTELKERLEAIQINRETELAKIEASLPKTIQPVKPGLANDDHAFSLDLSGLLSGADSLSTTDDQLNALYRKYERMLWQISPGASVTPGQLQAFVPATGMRMEKLNGRDFKLTLEKGNDELTVTVMPVLSGAEYDAAIAEFNRDMERFQTLNEQRERQLSLQKEALEKRMAEEKRMAQLKFEDRIAELRKNGLEYAALDEIMKRKVVNRFRATGFGIWNCDRPLPPNIRVFSANFKSKDGQSFENRTAYLVDQNRNTVYRFLAEENTPLSFNVNSNNLLWLMTDDHKIAVFRPEDFKAISEGAKELTLELEIVDKTIEDENDVREVLYL